MRPVTYSMTVSLDGFVTDADGGLDWADPDRAVFEVALEEIRKVGVHLMGRRLYETMLVWEDPHAGLPQEDVMRAWAAIWLALPKVVFSRTLGHVRGNARLASDDLAVEIARLRAGPGDGEIAIGGAALAAQAAGLGLIDEYRARVCPVIIGGGTPFHARGPGRTRLDLVEARTVGTGVVYLRHRVVRPDPVPSAQRPTA